MSLTTAQRVRLRIMDIPAWVDAVYSGNGLAVDFALPDRNIVSGSAYIPIGGTAWSGTGATFNASGVVSFSGVVSAYSAFRVRYVASMFSDTELDDMLERGGTVAGAALEAVSSLMFDGLRRSHWKSPDGTEVNDTAALDYFKTLYQALQAEVSSEVSATGSVIGWAETQEEYL